MPSIKMKTHKGLKKRFKVSATGKVRHKKCGSSHLNSHKSGKTIRELRGKSTLKVNAVARKYCLALGLRTPHTTPKPAVEVESAGEAAS